MGALVIKVIWSFLWPYLPQVCRAIALLLVRRPPCAGPPRIVRIAGVRIEGQGSARKELLEREFRLAYRVVWIG